MSHKLTQFTWGDYELEINNSRTNPPRIVYCFYFFDIDEQYDRACARNRAMSYHEYAVKQDVYVSEGDIQILDNYQTPYILPVYGKDPSDTE